MSKTDNTRPYVLQAADNSLPGYIFHQCGPDRPCDYSPESGVKQMRIGNPDGTPHSEAGCFRCTYYYGGVQEDSKGPRRYSKRLDSRERRYAAKRALRRAVDFEDVDILPVRADRGDHNWFN